ncbi:MAG TPA: hypothetical protein VJ798_11675 [Rhizomicrobium sp.]|nr:hypothetical protein [Rhizomicrobium sp.]
MIHFATNLLRLRYSPEDQYHGELHVGVQGGGFSGHGSAWFDTETIECFCNQLSAYPLVDDQLPVLEAGYWNDGVLSQVHLSLRVTKRDNRGGLTMNVALNDGDGRSVLTRLDIGYEDLSQFQLAIRSMMMGTDAEVTLTAQPT